MAINRFGKIVAMTTLLVGLFGALVGGLLAYAIPTAPQAFVDLAQRRGDRTKMMPVIVHADGPAGVVTTQPTSIPAGTESSTAQEGSTRWGLQVGVTTATGQPVAPGYERLLSGGALGGATGLIIGLPCALALAVIDQILLAFRSVYDSIRARFGRPGSTALVR